MGIFLGICNKMKEVKERWGVLKNFPFSEDDYLNLLLKPIKQIQNLVINLLNSDDVSSNS